MDVSPILVALFPNWCLSVLSYVTEYYIYVLPCVFLIVAGYKICKWLFFSRCTKPNLLCFGVYTPTISNLALDIPSISQVYYSSHQPKAQIVCTYILHVLQSFSGQIANIIKSFCSSYLKLYTDKETKHVSTSGVSLPSTQLITPEKQVLYGKTGIGEQLCILANDLPFIVSPFLRKGPLVIAGSAPLSLYACLGRLLYQQEVTVINTRTKVPYEFTCGDCFIRTSDTPIFAIPSGPTVAHDFIHVHFTLNPDHIIQKHHETEIAQLIHNKYPNNNSNVHLLQFKPAAQGNYLYKTSDMHNVAYEVRHFLDILPLQRLVNYVLLISIAGADAFAFLIGKTLRVRGPTAGKYQIWFLEMIHGTYEVAAVMSASQHDTAQSTQ